MADNSFEKFIRENRAAFDDGVPSLKVWGQIDKALEQKRSRLKTRRLTWSAAAAVALLFSVGFTTNVFNLGKQQTLLAKQLSRIDPEYAETVTYYQQEISRKYEQLTNLPAQVQVTDVDKDFFAIDQAMKELRQELSIAPKGTEEEIIQYLIKSYQLKLDILERVLQTSKIVEDDENYSQKNERNEIGI